MEDTVVISQNSDGFFRLYRAARRNALETGQIILQRIPQEKVFGRLFSIKMKKLESAQVRPSKSREVSSTSCISISRDFAFKRCNRGANSEGYCRTLRHSRKNNSQVDTDSVQTNEAPPADYVASSKFGSTDLLRRSYF